MKVVAGLGNPGGKYVGTRHNIGFEVLNELSRKLAAPAPTTKNEGQITSVNVAGEKLLLLWPLTYMNNSGRCVQAITSFYKIDSQHDLMVVCDDLSLPTGKLRLRPKGSAGGQKGLADILRALGSQEIPRLRIGIDQAPPRWETADYVLGKFREDERELVQDAIGSACSAIEDWCKHDLGFCMNRYNQKAKP